MLFLKKYYGKDTRRLNSLILKINLKKNAYSEYFTQNKPLLYLPDLSQNFLGNMCFLSLFIQLLAELSSRELAWYAQGLVVYHQCLKQINIIFKKSKVRI